MPTLLVLLKRPAAGRVKTRLAASVGAEAAAALYREWIGEVFANIQAVRGEIRVVGFYDGAAPSDFEPWTSLADAWWQQPPGDLGHRLATGFSQVPENEPVAAIGTDCLEITSSLVREAFERLQNHYAVFGPTFDGGYYLVGAARRLPSFFSGVCWSSQDTLASHLATCRRNGYSHATLRTLRDIDTWEDLQLHYRERRRDR